MRKLFYFRGEGLARAICSVVAVLFLSLAVGAQANDKQDLSPLPGPVFKLIAGGQVREFVADPDLVLTPASAKGMTDVKAALLQAYPDIRFSEVNGQSVGVVPLNAAASRAEQRTALLDGIRATRSADIKVGLRDKFSPADAAAVRFATNQIIIRVKDAVQAAAVAKNTKAKAPTQTANFLVRTSKGEYWMLEYPTAADALEAAETLAGSGMLAEINFKRAVGSRLVPNDPLYPGTAPESGQWNFRGGPGIGLNIETAWDTVLGNGVVAAVIDDGTQLSHPDLQPNARQDLSLDLAGNGGNNPAPAAGDTHGTATAGLVAARGGNGIFMTGAAPRAGIAAIRLFTDTGPGNLITDTEVAKALTWQNQSISVYNNSWGFVSTTLEYIPAGILTKDAIAKTVSQGRGGLGGIIVWAAGNDAQRGDMANWDGQGNSPYVFDVGALDSDGGRSIYSETGANLLVCAPSNGLGTLGITSIYPPSTSTSDFGGTSAAAPQVAGVAALLLQARPDLTYRDLKEILIRTAVKVDDGAPGALPWDNWHTNSAGFRFNNQYGAGLVNATAALNTARTWIPLLPEVTYTSVQDDLNIQVPDNTPTGVSIPFEFSTTGQARVGVVEVTVDMTHTRGYRSEIQIQLISPSGTVSYLTEENNLSRSTGDIKWTFTTVHSWGEKTNGTWRIFMFDDVGADTSTVHSAGITIHTVNLDLPPTVSLTSPANGEIRIAGIYAGNATASASDDRKVSKVEFFLDGASFAVDKAAPYQVSLTTVPAGVHKLYAVATDNWNQSTKSKTVTVDIREPAYLSVNLSPQGAVSWGAKWYTGNNGKMYQSGKTLVVPSGTNQRIGFGPALGYASPPKQTFNLAPFERAKANGKYLRPGGLSVSVEPFIMSPMPKWRFNGGKWLVSSQAFQGMRPGPYTIEFSNVKGYKTPATRTVIVNPAKYTTVVGKYTKISSGGGGGGHPAPPDKGSLQVIINPFTVPFKWSLAGSNKVYASYQVISLKTGTYTVVFLPKAGYKTPAPKTAVIKKNKTTLIKVTAQPK